MPLCLTGIWRDEVLVSHDPDSRIGPEEKTAGAGGRETAVWTVVLAPLESNCNYLRLSGNSQAVEDPFDLSVLAALSVVVADE